MNVRNRRGIRAAGILLVFAFGLAQGSVGCGDCGGSGSGGGGSARVPNNAITVIVAYGSEKKTWLEEEARAFEAGAPKTPSGKPIHIELKAMGSGEAMQAILHGDLKAHVFSPASTAYITLLNDAWIAQGGHTKALAPAGEPLVLSPVVIAMWKPMAEALGWPQKNLGWQDLIKVSTNPAGWGGLGHPEWGGFKLGHTHPEFSNSGLLAVLAEAYAGAGKTRRLEAADLELKRTRDLITTVERSIVHYGKSTGFFADKMRSRGPGYLSAAVLYENVVIESYGKPAPAAFPIVSIYPREGTFWSDHPYSVLDADWVGDEQRAAAKVLLDFLKSRPAQERALALGFRPSDPAVAISAPIDAAHGADPKQPQTLLDVPDAAVLNKLIALWQTTKRATDVILVFDKSGSMDGQPLIEAKRGARTFLDSLHADDLVTFIAFDNEVYPGVGPLRLADGKAQIAARVDSLFASGGTALYDVIAAAYEQAQKRALSDPARTHAVVVMTDGLDENSQLGIDALKARLGGGEGHKQDASDVKIFTIAYGAGASDTVLGEIAETASGSSAKGSVANITQVFQDMASFF